MSAKVTLAAVLALSMLCLLSIRPRSVDAQVQWCYTQYDGPCTLAAGNAKSCEEQCATQDSEHDNCWDQNLGIKKVHTVQECHSAGTGSYFKQEASLANTPCFEWTRCTEDVRCDSGTYMGCLDCLTPWGYHNAYKCKEYGTPTTEYIKNCLVLGSTGCSPS